MNSLIASEKISNVSQQSSYSKLSSRQSLMSRKNWVRQDFSYNSSEIHLM